MSKDPKIKLVEESNGNLLVISLAEAKDAGEYECKVSANMPTTIRHNIQIRGKKNEGESLASNICSSIDFAGRKCHFFVIHA